MDIVVLVKQVPDTWAERRLSDSDKTLDRESVDAVMNEIDEYAVEEALRLKEAHGGEVTVLTMGPDAGHRDDPQGAVDGRGQGGARQRPGAARLLRRPDRGGARRGARHGAEYDLVVCGSESTDARLSVMAALLPRSSASPQLTGARKVDGGRLDGDDRAADRDRLRPGRRARRPAVVSVVEKINEPRYPSFKGIMAAKKKPVDHGDASPTSASTPAQVGLASATSEVVDVTLRAAAAGRPGRQGRGRRRGQARRVPRVPEARSERERRDMAEVLVLVEHADGIRQEGHARAAHRGPRARRAGGGRRRRARQRGAAGRQARRVRRGEGLRRPSPRTLDEYLVTPKAEVLAQLVVGRRPPAAVLIASTAEGKEVAARLAMKTAQRHPHRRRRGRRRTAPRPRASSAAPSWSGPG